MQSLNKQNQSLYVEKSEEICNKVEGETLQNFGTKWKMKHCYEYAQTL